MLKVTSPLYYGTAKSLATDAFDIELMCIALCETIAAISIETGLDEEEVSEMLALPEDTDKEFDRVVRNTILSVASKAEVDPIDLAQALSCGGSVDEMVVRLRASSIWGMHEPGHA